MRGRWEPPFPPHPHPHPHPQATAHAEVDSVSAAWVPRGPGKPSSSRPPLVWDVEGRITIRPEQPTRLQERGVVLLSLCCAVHRLGTEKGAGRQQLSFAGDGAMHGLKRRGRGVPVALSCFLPLEKTANAVHLIVFSRAAEMAAAGLGLWDGDVLGLGLWTWDGMDACGRRRVVLRAITSVWRRT